MLTQIVVDSENAFTVPILGVTPKESLFISNIDGLDAPDITLFIGDYSRDGGTYQGRRVEDRNVVLTFTLNPNPALGETVSGWRDVLYKAFINPFVNADLVTLELYDDEGRIRFVSGAVEKFETAVFDQDTSAQISIICPDPYIRDADETVLTPPPPATGWVSTPFPYNGTAPTGFEVDIVITAPTAVLTLDNNGYKMVINDTFVTGDVIHVNTNRGYRDIEKTPAGGGDDIPIVYKLTAASPWIELHSQTNTVQVYGTDDTNTIANIQEIRFSAAYWGV